MAEEAHISEDFKVIDPFRGYQEGDIVTLTLYDTYLEVTGAQEPLKIDYDKLTGAIHGTSQELHKTVAHTFIGAAVGDIVGGLFGMQDLGNLIGTGAGFASTGLHADEYHKRLLITYKDEDDNECTLHLLDEKNKQGKEIAQELSEYARIKVGKKGADF